MGEQWYIHIHGETIGPISFDVVAGLVRCARLMPSDFLWTQGMAAWERVGNLKQFASSLPLSPSTPLPLPPDEDLTTQDTNFDHATAEAVEIPMEKGSSIGEHRRFWVLRMVRVCIDGVTNIESFGKFSIYDLSETGVFQIANNAVPMGTKVRFTLESKDLPRPLALSGTVARIGFSKGGQNGFAIRFDSMGASERICIQELVRTKHVKTSLL